MHRCLLVPEIVGLICGECGDSSKCDLASLARTSRNFQEPALHHLWYKLEDLTPLITCMPQDLWKVQGGNLGFRRAITNRDWSIFEQYARRVRIIDGITVCQPIHVPPEEYLILSMAAGGRTLLPNITNFSWIYHEVDQSFPFLWLFLGPNLTTFRICVPDSLPSPHFSVLANLGTQHPALTTVEVMTRVQNLQASAALSIAIGCWNDLRCLNVNGLSSDALIHVAMLPSLQSLWLGGCYELNPPVDFPSDFPHSNAFSSLRKLSVARHTFSYCTKLLNSMSDTPLASIRFNGFRFCPTSKEWMDLVFAVQTGCRPSVLLSLVIIDHPPEIIPQYIHMHTYTLTKDYLCLLLGFHNMNHVELNTAGVFDIDDATVKEMAVAWPQIERLLLMGNATSFKSRITLAGLRSLAEHCHHLKELSLAFDAQAVPPMEVTPRVSCQLFRLDVLNSPIRYCDEVAAFLSDIFPNLLTVYASIIGGQTSNLWKDVSRFVVTFASVRAQEVARAKLVNRS